METYVDPCMCRREREAGRDHHVAGERRQQQAAGVSTHACALADRGGAVGSFACSPHAMVLQVAQTVTDPWDKASFVYQLGQGYSVYGVSSPPGMPKGVRT